MHCHLLVPGFGWPQGEALELCHALAPFALETLISRGRRTRDSAAQDTNAERWLFERFGVPRQRDWPAAPFSLLAEGGSPGDAIWMCADPVNLRINRNQLVLADCTQFGIARDEAEALAGSINTHFVGSLVVYPMQAQLWYARLASRPDMETTPLAMVRGGAIEAKLPVGPDSMRWQALVNELQMLLHDHPVNLAREQRGELAVNSVWLWGAGQLPPVSSRPFQTVAASAPLARGLALASGAQAQDAAQTAQAWLALPDSGHRTDAHAGVSLVVLDALAAPSQYGQADAWRDALSQLERDWFGPLLAMLRQGRIGMLTLHLLGVEQALDVEVAQADLRRFWRRRKSLAEWMA